MKILKIMALFCSSLSLLSCATQQLNPNLPTQETPSQQAFTTTPREKTEKVAGKQETLQTNLATIPSANNLPNSWELSGAMAARSKNKNWTASINWLQSGPGSYQIRLIGPLGNGSAIIEKRGAVVSYKEGNKVSTSKNAESLLSQKTGVSLPVPSLYYWVRGLPSPGKINAQKRSPQGQLLFLQQGGFSIEYLKYTQVGSTYLPSLIRLQGGGVFVKLAIKNWRI